MIILKSKQGIGIAYVIGIVTFVLALVTTLFAVTINQAILIKKSADNAELYANNVYQLTSAGSIINDDPTILADSQKLAALSTLLDLTIVQPLGKDYWQLTNNDLEMPLTSYLKFIPPGSGGFIEFDDLLISEDFENLVLGIYSIPHDFHIEAVSAFYNEFFYNLTVTNPARSTFQEIMVHAAANKAAYPQIIYKPDNFAINTNTIIPTNQILVVNGTLSIRADFNGIAIVRDSITVYENDISINGAFYAGGSFISYGNNTTYAYSKNSFIFANSFTTGGAQSGTNDPNPTYKLYSFSNALNINSNKSFTGGFFTDIVNDINVKNALITFSHLTNPMTLADGVPLNLFIEFTGEGRTLGDGQVLSTFPR